MTAGLPKPQQKNQDMTVVLAQDTSIEKPLDLRLSRGVQSIIDFLLFRVENDMNLLNDLRGKLKDRLAVNLRGLGATEADGFDKNSQLLHYWFRHKPSFHHFEILERIVSYRAHVLAAGLSTYSFKLLFVVVGPDTKERQQGLEVLESVHHRGSGETPTICGIKPAACLGRFG